MPNTRPLRTAVVAVTTFFSISAHAATTLIPADTLAADRFGYSVGLSGLTSVISAPGDDPAGVLSGSAYVFVRTGATWLEQAKLVPSDGAPSAAFGVQVAVEGDTAVVGAPYALVGGLQAGAAYVFVRSGAAWTQQAKLVASDGALSDYFGSTLSISGNTVVVGAPYADIFGQDSGAAYVFVRSGTAWTQEAKVFPADSRSSDFFGTSVSVSGNTFAAGSPNDDDNAVASGSTYVFVRAGTSWSQQQKIRPVDGANADLFGNSVALDANTVVVTAPDDDDHGIASGSAYVYARAGTSWAQQQKISAADGAPGDFFGSSVALKGNSIAVGAPFDDEAAVDVGSAYLYTRTGAVWALKEKLLSPDGTANDDFGGSVALDPTEPLVVVGAEQHDQQGPNGGAAYVFGGPPAGVPALNGTWSALLALLLGGSGPLVIGFRRRVSGAST